MANGNDRRLEAVVERLAELVQRSQCDIEQLRCEASCTAVRDRALLALQPERSQEELERQRTLLDCTVRYAGDPDAIEECQREVDRAFEEGSSAQDTAVARIEAEHDRCLARCAANARRCREEATLETRDNAPEIPREEDLVPDGPPRIPDDTRARLADSLRTPLPHGTVAFERLRHIAAAELPARARQRGRARADDLVEAARGKRRRQLGAAEDPARRTRRRQRLAAAFARGLDTERLRSPNQVLGDFARRVQRWGKPVGERGTIILDAPSSDEDHVLDLVRRSPLVDLDIAVRGLRIGKQPLRYYELSLPLPSGKLERELRNVAWALRKEKVGRAAWPGERRLYLFAGEPTHATQAPASFAWHMDMMHGRSAHDVSPGHADGAQQGEGAVVAHPDTGWADHPEFNRDQIDRARSRNVLTDRSGGTAACHSILLADRDEMNITHGTATGSLIVGGPPGGDRPEIAGISEQDLGSEHPMVDEGRILGVAPRATVVPIKFIADGGVDWDAAGPQGVGVLRIGDARFVEFINYARDIGADVMSLSVGGMLSDAVRAAMHDAILNDDMIVVAAAGQTYFFNVASVLSPNDSVIEPARFQHVIAVAGCSPDGRPWDESHRGPNIDITAPGDAIWVAEFDREEADDDGVRASRLEAASGTSFATAITAGAAALWVAHWGGRAKLKETYPDTPLAWVFREVLQQTARPVFDGPWDSSMYGPGVLDLQRLLKEPLPAPESVPEPPATVANLLTGVEWVGDLLDSAGDWAADLWRDGEEAVAAGLLIAEGVLEGALAEATDRLADGYAALEDAGAAASEWLGNAVAAGEAMVGAMAGAAEDAAVAAGEAAEGASDVVEEVVETVATFVSDAGEAAVDAWNDFWS